MNEKSDNFTAIVAMLVAWSALMIMLGYVIGTTPS